MNLLRSLRGVFAVFRESRRFSKFDCSPTWYLRFYYSGRLARFIGKAEAEEIVPLRYRGRIVRFPVTPVYCGALSGVFVDDEYNLDDLLNSPVQRVLDLGANVGMAAIVLQCQFPEASFLLVEPDPRNLLRLGKAVELNNMSASIVPAAVDWLPGTMTLRMGDNPTCSALQTSMMHDYRDGIEVACLTVAELLDRVGWDTVDLVKIDVEGAEEAILTRNNTWLERARAVVLEIHPTCSPAVIAASLAEYGFTLRRHGHGREPVYFAGRKG